MPHNVKGCSGTAKHPASPVCTITAQRGQSTTPAAPQGTINGLSIKANWTLITLKLDAKYSGLLGAVPDIKRKVTKQWDVSRQHPGLHSSAPERNKWFGYMGKHSLNFIHFLENQRLQISRGSTYKHLPVGKEQVKQKREIPASPRHAHGKSLFFLQQQPEDGLEKANSMGNQEVTSKNQQGKLTHCSKQQKYHPQHSWLLNEAKKGIFPKSYRRGNYKEKQLMPDDFHTLCCPSTPRKPESMPMHIRISLWDGLPPTATHIQQLWHFAP